MTLTIVVTSKQEILNGSEVLYPWKKVISVVSNRSIVWIWTWKIRKRSVAEKITFDWKMWIGQDFYTHKIKYTCKKKFYDLSLFVLFPRGKLQYYRISKKVSYHVEISSKLTSHSGVLRLYIANFFHAVSFYIPRIVFFEPFLYCREGERVILLYIVENSFLSKLVYRCVCLFDISIYY